MNRNRITVIRLFGAFQLPSIECSDHASTRYAQQLQRRPQTSSGKHMIGRYLSGNDQLRWHIQRSPSDNAHGWRAAPLAEMTAIKDGVTMPGALQVASGKNARLETTDPPA